MNKTCKLCNTQKPITEFYSRSDRATGSTYCKKCFNKYTGQRWVATKIKAIEYKGSICCDCGFSYPEKPYAIFDFHHTNPTEKDGDWTKLRKKSWTKILAELDKCILLCSNCHRIRHFTTASSGFEPEFNA